jgi:hypothetical protein
VININWPEVLPVELGDAQLSFEMFNKKMNDVLDTHVPIKKVNKKNFDFKQNHGLHLVLLYLLKGEIGN